MAETLNWLGSPPPQAAQDELPRARRERFQLLRAGILNLWQYDEQELRFEDGRLILRGENGTGKSKALELLLPFLLDADLSPQRLDPFGGTSRTMEWNLLQGGRYESRVGYVWLEVGKRGKMDERGEADRASQGLDLSQEAADRRAKRLWERSQTLGSDLGADYHPRLEQDGDLLILRVVYNGRDHDVKSLLDALRESIEVRRSLLADHERELLSRFLLGEVGDHLRNRLREARALVGEMNELLERCRTASGMALRLAWDPFAESAPEVRDATGLLNRDFALLTDPERRRLEAFFQSRISAARDQWESVPWREHLMAALDYRSWYRFRILRRTGPSQDWTELTRRGHGASSGGEKAVALHLPLFAAAAAHYRSARPSAPRLILLDEAFAGIDQGMRGRCMGLLVALDLDFLMTSHDEWGFYEELPAVATYQLYRDPVLEGVAAVRMVWNGRSPEPAAPEAGAPPEAGD